MTKVVFPSLFKVQQSLGSLESEVMKNMWDEDERTVREVLVNLQQRKTVAYTTVMTVMNNLYRKGYLTRRKIKKTYFYYSLKRENTLINQAIAGVFHDLTSNYGKFKIVSSLVGYSLLSLPFFPAISKLNYIATLPKTAFLYGLSFTLFSLLLIFSSWDLVQNLQFFGTIGYLQLTLSDPTILFDKLPFFVPAFLESLPIINLVTTIFSLAAVAILFKKLLQLFDFKTPLFQRLGGIT